MKSNRALLLTLMTIIGALMVSVVSYAQTSPASASNTVTTTGVTGGTGRPISQGVPGSSDLISVALSGSTEISVADTTGFAVSDYVRIDDGFNSDYHTVTGVSADSITITPEALDEIISSTPVEEPLVEFEQSPSTDLAVYVVPDRFLPGDSTALVVAQALSAEGIPTNFTCNSVRVTTDVVDGISVRQGLVQVPEGLTCGEDASFASGTIDSTGSPSPTQITVTQSGVTGTTVTATAHTRSVDAFDLNFATRRQAPVTRQVTSSSPVSWMQPVLRLPLRPRCRFSCSLNRFRFRTQQVSCRVRVTSRSR